MKKIDNKIIMVTGSGRGFGRAMAYSFSVRGATTILVALEKKELEQTSKKIKSIGGNSHSICTDLSKTENIYNLKKEIDSNFGRIDAVVNNAALCPWHGIEETSSNEWDEIFAVNVRAPYLLAKLLKNDMRLNGGGSIINITSRSSEIGFLGEVAFSPSKWALEGLTQCLALELHSYNIAVNTLLVASPEGKQLKPTGLTQEEADLLPPEKKKLFPTEEEMSDQFGDAWAFLALQNAQKITGQRISTREISEYLRDKGDQAALKRWSHRLTEAVYRPYDFPKSVKYQTPGGGKGEKKYDFSTHVRGGMT
jgi:NAD(P)-dependent dehydrogenase (short-subunit alcohol dehydrogenase family)